MNKLRGFNRLDRIDELIKRELASILSKKCRDPRIANVSITKVVTTKDLTLSKVYFSSIQKETAVLVKDINKAAGFFRSELATKIKKLRKIPELKFIYDDSLEKAQAIFSLLDKVREES